MKPALLLHADRCGLGDCLHGRGIVAPLTEKYEIWMRTRWPQVFHDMPVRFDEPPADAKAMTIGYHPSVVLRYGSVLGAMGLACGVEPKSFALPIPDDWQRKARAMLEDWRPTKPLLIVRPLLDTAGPDNPAAKRARNPDHDAYAALLAGLSARFFTVAVANCRGDGGEWLVGPQIEPDIDATEGELDFETLAALSWMADLVFCPPGFATVLAQAVETPCITVFGGYEDARSFSTGTSPWLPIEPLTPCPCWRDDCAGDKTIDLIAALGKIERFVEGLR